MHVAKLFVKKRFAMARKKFTAYLFLYLIYTQQLTQPTERLVIATPDIRSSCENKQINVAAAIIMKLFINITWWSIETWLLISFLIQDLISLPFFHVYSFTVVDPGIQLIKNLTNQTFKRIFCSPSNKKTQKIFLKTSDENKKKCYAKQFLKNLTLNIKKTAWLGVGRSIQATFYNRGILSRNYNESNWFTTSQGKA